LLIVVDTNIIVSGLLNPAGAPGRIVDLIAANLVQVAYDDRVLAEYEDVLSRAPFSFSLRQVSALIDHIRLNGTFVSSSPLPQGAYPDPRDLPFAEVAIAAGAGIIVTGNKAHFSFVAAHGIAVLSAAEFLRQI
jgi:putative PIN family toxin of toxin-antitoxin system